MALFGDGRTLAVGVHYNDGNEGVSGHIKIYVWNDLIWGSFERMLMVKQPMATLDRG